MTNRSWVKFCGQVAVGSVSRLRFSSGCRGVSCPQNFARRTSSYSTNRVEPGAVLSSKRIADLRQRLAASPSPSNMMSRFAIS